MALEQAMPSTENESMTVTQILVVEDESVVAMDIQSRLMGLGYRVPAIVARGEDAVEKAESLRPDLVLMDIRLKGQMDGVEAASHIRARLDIPVVFLTAYADAATLERAKTTESYGYLLKPFKEGELRTTIEMALYKHQMERRVKQSEQWLSTTLSSIGDAVIATDVQGRIQFMNPVAEALTGWQQDEALGQALEQVFRIVNGLTHEPCASPFEKVLDTGDVVLLSDNTLLRARDGKTMPIDDSAAPIRDEKGGIVGVVIVFRDITERVRAQAALSRHARELQARNEELDAFAQTVAHDLKNPVHLIQGFADTLEECHRSLDDARLERYLHIIAQNGRKMNRIIDELLLLAGVRQKKDLEIEPLDMARIVVDAQSHLAHLIEEHRVEITLPAAWPQALGYAPWVEEVWANYLSNGIKYGGRPPRLLLGGTRTAKGSVCFWIRDNGPGLTPEEQAKLFTPFTQLDRIRANGSGLGLSIVQRIVERLDGQVGVHSQVGKGSTFYFVLPGTPAHATANGRIETGRPAQ
jgi:PAS domain S-box-containing protein